MIWILFLSLFKYTDPKNICIVESQKYIKFGSIAKFESFESILPHMSSGTSNKKPPVSGWYHLWKQFYSYNNC